MDPPIIGDPLKRWNLRFEDLSRWLHHHHLSVSENSEYWKPFVGYWISCCCCFCCRCWFHSKSFENIGCVSRDFYRDVQILWHYTHFSAFERTIRTFTYLYIPLCTFNTPLRTFTYLYAPLHTFTHLYTPLHTITHLNTPLRTFNAPLHTFTHLNTPLHTITHLYTPLCTFSAPLHTFERPPTN